MCNIRRESGEVGESFPVTATALRCSIYSLNHKFNVLWLNPQDYNSFPPGLLDALELHTTVVLPPSKTRDQGDSIAARLRRQMQAEALNSVSGDDNINRDAKGTEIVDLEVYSDILEETAQFLRLQVCNRVSYTISLISLCCLGTRSASFGFVISARPILLLLLVWYSIRRRGDDGISVSWSRRRCPRLIRPDVIYYFVVLETGSDPCT